MTSRLDYYGPRRYVVQASERIVEPMSRNVLDGLEAIHSAFEYVVVEDVDHVVSLSVVRPGVLTQEFLKLDRPVVGCTLDVWPKAPDVFADAGHVR